MKKIIFSILIFLSLFIAAIKVNASSDVSVSIYDEASIRTTDSCGIRFKAQVTNPQNDYTYGMVFINYKVQNAEDLTLNTPNSVNTEVDGLTENHEYAISMVNLPEYGYLDDITVRAYVKIADNTYIYSSTITSRSIKEVADEVYKTDQSNEYINNIALFNKTILVRYDALSSTVDYNTPSENLNLPKTVTLYDKYDNPYNVGVTWDLSTYDKSQSGTFNIIGTLDLGTEYIKKRFDVMFELTVKVNPIIFSYDFVSMETLDSSWVNKSDNFPYADKSLAFKDDGKYIITPSFRALSSFRVKADIKGNGTSGNAVITMYGLDKDGNKVETIKFEQVIPTTNSTLTATFTATSITNIKFEYTTKAIGNVGLYTLIAEYTEDVILPGTDELTSISFEDYQTNYQINSTFNYSGTIIKTYTSGNIEKVALADIINEVEVEFNSSSIGDFEGVLTYLGKTITFHYKVSELDVNRKVDNVTVYAIDLSSGTSDTISIISIIQDTTKVNIILDFGKTFNETTKTTLNNKLEAYLNSKVSYYYSNNNSSYFDSLSAIKLTLDEETTYTNEIILNLSANNFILEAFGYNYYNVQNIDNSSIGLDKKVDVLWSNNMVTSDLLSQLDPETVILPEGDLNSFINIAKRIYTYDDEIFQYSPTLNSDIWHVFTDTSYYLDGESTTELSGYDKWSNAETDGLHHASQINYLYREAYYGNIRGLSGESLRKALKKVITNTHTNIVSYGSNRYDLAKTDADPFKEGNIILIYSGESISNVWDGSTWNREHVWPKALSGGLYTSDNVDNSYKGPGSDLHQIKPEYASVNSSRSDKKFGSITTSTTYEPRDAVKGDIARILFYMSVRYDMDIDVLNVADSKLLLEWIVSDPVDSFERNRNKTVQSIQGNYNPFIDNPWLADLIW